jgi:nicotinamide-nucleotide amidase
MIAEVISIGDELTSGQRLDTNSQWLSQRLGEQGIRVLYHTTVADDLEANIRVFREAAARADIIVATGGLGPTADDLTREVMARAAGCELELHEDVLEHIRGLFKRFGRDMPERNRSQALFPAGSRVIPNPHGTAPGIALEIPRPGRAAAQIYALPGVPAEMTEMWEQWLVAELARLTGAASVIRHRRIKCFGAGESHVESMLPDLIRRGREPSVGITVSGATITLRITARGATAESCYEQMEPTAHTIYECLGELVFGEEDDELEHAVVRGLCDQERTLATVEWGTGGMIAHWLDEVAQARDCFLGGLVVTSPASAETLLGVPASLIRQHTPVSAAIVEALATRAQAQSGADFALAVSELPPLNQVTADSARVYYALATPRKCIVKSVPSLGHPAIYKLRAAKVGLNLVRLALRRDIHED